MPAQVTKALVQLERALALDPTYALAHAFAAMCHHCLFLRSGLHEENRLASVRHAQAAIVHGRDDALALTHAGFSIGMDGHDRAAAFTALEAALAISPSSALTYILGSVILAWGGEAERAIEWSERGMRLSPLDPWAFAAFDAQALSYFHLGRYDKAAQAAYKSVQANPAHSITYVQLAAALAKLGRLEEAKAAAAKVLELHPTFRYSRQFCGVNCAPALAESMVKRFVFLGCLNNRGTYRRLRPFVSLSVVRLRNRLYKPALQNLRQNFGGPKSSGGRSICGISILILVASTFEAAPL